MNKILAFFAIALLSLSFAVANDQVQDNANINDVLIPTSSSVQISLVSPADGSSFVTADGVAPVSFYFSYKSDFVTVQPVADVSTVDVLIPNNVEISVDASAIDAILANPSNDITQIISTGNPSDVNADLIYAVYDSSVKCSAFVRINDLNVKEIEATTDLASSVGKAEGSFAVGDYKWFISCQNDLGKWNSAERVFSVTAPVVVIPPTNSGSTEEETPTVSSSSNDDDEGSSRRFNTLPLNALSNPTANANNLQTTDSSTDSQENQPAGITGAVIGALGRTGALGIGIFIALVGVIALVVYNRERLGFVKN
ncbi:MAG: hypothetical protein ACP5NS_03105 [Candidatus Pacearchaeota archaeon]